MSLKFLQTPESRQQDVADFLVSAFGLPADAPFVAPPLLRWKYFEPRPDWDGSRSYIMTEGDQIAAHGCAYPVTFLTPDGDVLCNNLIDWGAIRSSLGAGVSLLRNSGRLTPGLLAVGGSADTRQILPKLGYREAGQRDLFVRILKPWSQMRSDPYPRGWKEPLRLLRNTARSLTPLAALPPDWSCLSTSVFDDSITHLLPRSKGTPFIPAARSPELLNYVMRCPGAGMSGFLIYHKGEMRGWFLLSRLGGQGRIADLWVDSAEPGDWRFAFLLATHTAKADPRIFELVASGSVPPIRQAILASGYHLHHTDPVFLRDPKSLIGPAALLNVALIDGDHFFLHDASYPYLS